MNASVIQNVRLNFPKNRVSGTSGGLRWNLHQNGTSNRFSMRSDWRTSLKGTVWKDRKMMRIGYDRITTTIERQWLAEIIAGTKKIEYRQIKPYWTKRFEKVSVPFELRLLNGMNPPVPEVTVLIHKIVTDRRGGEYQLHIKKVLGFKHWDKRRQKPKR